MSAHLVRAAVRRFGISVLEVGRLLLVGERTVRRWVSRDKAERQDVPGPAEIVLELLMREQITLDQLRAARDRVKHRWSRLGRRPPQYPP